MAALHANALRASSPGALLRSPQGITPQRTTKDASSALITSRCAAQNLTTKLSGQQQQPLRVRKTATTGNMGNQDHNQNHNRDQQQEQQQRHDNQQQQQQGLQQQEQKPQQQ